MAVVQNKVTKEGYVALHIRIGKAVHDTSRNKVTTTTKRTAATAQWL